MQHRRDIDGLRALAVVPVVLFHFGWLSIDDLPIAHGGFIGVDVFFVISGFLISRILYADISTGSYSVVGFYTRRIKRIFPALMAMYAVCLAAGVVLGVDTEAAEIRDAVLASAFFVSNLFFAGKAGYFDEAVKTNPLLHTWSLSIEEQFYVVFPLILWALRQVSHRQRMAILAVATLASLGYSEYLTRVQPDAAYYSFFARAWELSIGSLLALARWRMPPRWRAEIVAAIGLACVVGFIVAYDASRPFPGLGALVPCLGTAAILYAGMERSTLVSRLLGLAPFRFVGLISYSLYIWHWPFIVYLKLNGPNTLAGKLICLALCCLCATLSWRFVERPFRTLKPRGDRLAVLKGAAVAMAAIGALAAISVPVNAAFRPETPAVAALSKFRRSYDHDSSMRTGVCFLTRRFNDIGLFQPETCLATSPDRPRVLVVGDSHSAQYWLAMRNRYADADVLQASASGCLPNFENHGDPGCLALWNYVVRDFLPTHRMNAIVLAARWTAKSVDEAMEAARRLTVYADRVYVMGPNMEYASALPRLLIRAQYERSGDFLSQFRRPQPQRIDAKFLAHPLPPNVTYVSFFQALCRPDCPIYAPDGEPMLFDDNHLTEAAAGQMVDAMRMNLRR